jgi:hypothetical protein
MSISKPVDAELLGTDFQCRELMRFIGMRRGTVLGPETPRQRNELEEGLHTVIFDAMTELLSE